MDSSTLNMRVNAHLPPELWRLILRFTTAVPDLLDTTPLPPLGYEERAFTLSWNEHFAAGELASRDKRNLILVCKNWHSIALGFLYESIRITKTEQFFALLRSLGSHAAGTQFRAPSSRHLARSIKSLWLVFGSRPADGSPNPSELNFALETLLTLCVNLQIFRIWSCIHLAFPAAGLSSSLRFIYMTCDAMNESKRSPHLFDSFAQPGNLSALQLTLCDLAGFEFGPEFPQSPFSLPNLHSLILRFESASDGGRIMRLMALWELPRLVYLSISNDFDFGDQFSPDIQRFFHSFGRNLTSIVVDGLPNEIVTNIIKWSPSVQNLCLKLDQPNLYHILKPAPKLKRIQLSSLWVKPIDHDYETLVKVAEALYETENPPLQCIQLMDIANVDVVRRLDWEKWRELSEKLLQRGVRFEDQRGVSIGSRFEDGD